MYYPTEVFRVQSEVQLLSYHGRMNVYPKLNPDIGRYLVFHVEFYQLLSGISGMTIAKTLTKGLSCSMLFPMMKWPFHQDWTHFFSHG